MENDLFGIKKDPVPKEQGENNQAIHCQKKLGTSSFYNFNHLLRLPHLSSIVIPWAVTSVMRIPNPENPFIRSVSASSVLEPV